MDGFLRVLFYYGLIREWTCNMIKIVCPFHADDRPSLQINLEKNFFYCYGCGAKGDAVDFVRMIEKCSPLKAYIIFNKIQNSKECKELKICVQKAVKKTKKEALEDAKIYFYSLPEVDWKANDIDKAALRYMLKRGFTRKVLNISKARINFNDTYPIIFPMYDNGEFKGHVSRAIIKDATRKYLYNYGFSRKSTLVGNYNKASPVVITEGYMDWLKLQQYGLNNSVAILGWKITDNQISKLQQMGITKIISALDNTPTGERGTKYLEEFFDVIRFQFPTSIKDVGDLDKFHFNKCWLETKQEMMKQRRK